MEQDVLTSDSELINPSLTADFRDIDDESGDDEVVIVSDRKRRKIDAEVESILSTKPRGALSMIVGRPSPSMPLEGDTPSSSSSSDTSSSYGKRHGKMESKITGDADLLEISRMWQTISGLYLAYYLIEMA